MYALDHVDDFASLCPRDLTMSRSDFERMYATYLETCDEDNEVLVGHKSDRSVII